jgi:hypothetical protein
VMSSLVYCWWNVGSWWYDRRVGTPSIH